MFTGLILARGASAHGTQPLGARRVAVSPSGMSPGLSEPRWRLAGEASRFRGGG